MLWLLSHQGGQLGDSDGDSEVIVEGDSENLTRESESTMHFTVGKYQMHDW